MERTYLTSKIRKRSFVECVNLDLLKTIQLLIQKVVTYLYTPFSASFEQDDSEKCKKHGINSLMSSETGKDKQRAHGTLERTNHAVHTVPRQKTLSTDYTVPYGPAWQVISDKHRQVLSTNALMILMVPNNASSSTQVMVFKWMPSD